MSQPLPPPVFDSLRDLPEGNDRGSNPHRIALVGSGPRGVSVLERLAARYLEKAPPRPVSIYLFDMVEPGCGRIYTTGQRDQYLMNTVCREVTMYSGPCAAGYAPRPGAGPSLAEWWETTHPTSYVGPNDYAPRRLHGQYLKSVVATIAGSLPPLVSLHIVRAEVVDVRRQGSTFEVHTRSGDEVSVESVVLATGHLPTRFHASSAVHALASDGTSPMLNAPTAAELPLDAIDPNESVGMIGLGLTFYDIVSALTLGRGGVFENDAAGNLSYLASGSEPYIVAGSRSGLPLPARGRNAHGDRMKFMPRLFVPERFAREPGAKVDFAEEVLPWIQAEVNLRYFEVWLAQNSGSDVAAAFVDRVSRITAKQPTDLRAVANSYATDPPEPLNLERLARPFQDQEFASPGAFSQALREYLCDDLVEARRGNAMSPLKAALDVMRDTRWVVRKIVDFNALTPESHQDAFLRGFAPLSSLLAAGPPLWRVEQLVALIDAGVVHILGPDIRLHHADGGMFLESATVANSRTSISVAIDARVPSTNVCVADSTLVANLLRSGVWRQNVNASRTTQFETGGVDVTEETSNPVDSHGEPVRGMYVLGVPTENTRWFTFVGSGRPGPWNEFTSMADAIASEVCLDTECALPIKENSYANR